jgi:CRP/FNR family transcriptional regulator, cyclic AMP receptor protein
MNDVRLIAVMHAHGVPRRRDQPTPGDWASVLASFPLFSGVSKRRLRKLARDATLAEFAPGEPITFAGDPEDWLYVILSGHAKTVKGDRRVLRVGEYFGEVALIDGRPLSATVVAVSYLHVMKLPSRSILTLLTGTPQSHSRCSETSPHDSASSRQRVLAQPDAARLLRIELALNEPPS